LPLYRYKAIGADGVALEGDMEARNQAAVVERLQATGHIPILVEDAAQPTQPASGASFGWFRSSRISQAEIGVFTREIATLLHAGLPLDRALEILVALSENDKVRKLLLQIRDDVRGGASLSAAMDAQKGVFTRFYLNMVRAGEAGGALGPVLMRITEFMERSKMLKETVMSALIYPAILVVVAVASVMLLMIFVVPQFSLMFQQSGKALPLPTQIVIGAGDFLRHDWWMLLLGLAAIALLMRQQLQNAASRYRWDGWFLRLPLVGDLVAKVEVARFSRSLGTLLGNGVTLLNALFIVKETLNNSVMAEGLDVVATQLKEGLGLGKPMMDTGLFPKLAVHMVMVGEETGQLEEMLLRVANVYDSEVQTSVKRMLGLMEPVLILGLGLLIGGIIMSILLAILGINDLAI
jgi:general secretion pathway protein F